MLKILNSTYYSVVNIDDSLGIGIGFNLGLMYATFLHLVLDKKIIIINIIIKPIDSLLLLVDAIIFHFHFLYKMLE